MLSSIRRRVQELAVEFRETVVGPDAVVRAEYHVSDRWVGQALVAMSSAFKVHLVGGPPLSAVADVMAHSYIEKEAQTDRLISRVVRGLKLARKTQLVSDNRGQATGDAPYRWPGRHGGAGSLGYSAEVTPAWLVFCYARGRSIGKQSRRFVLNTRAVAVSSDCWKHERPQSIFWVWQGNG